MPIIYDDVLPPAVPTAITHTILVGDRLFVFSDGTGLPRGEGPTFTVYDNGGNVVIAPQNMTDATEDQLGGWTYFGIFLPYIAQIRFIEMGQDGSFGLNYGGSDPIIQRDNPVRSPDFFDIRYFAPDGTPLDARPDSMATGTVFVGGNNGSIAATDVALAPLLDIGGTLASVAFTGSNNQNVTFSLTTGTERVSSTFTPSGENWNSFIPVRPLTMALEQAGDNIMLIYQDQGSRDVFVRLYDRNAVQVGTEFTLGGTDNTFYFGPAYESLHTLRLENGTIVVTWSSQRVGVDADPQLFQAHLAADGTILRGPEIVNTDLTSGNQYDGHIFALSDGGYAILYHTIGGSPYRQEALVRQYNADGTPVGDSVAFEALTPGQSLNAHFGAIFPNGFGYMIDGFGTEYTIILEGQPDPIPDPPPVPTTVSVAGSVVDVNGTALTGVQVRIDPADDPVGQSVTTGATGGFTFDVTVNASGGTISASRAYDPVADGTLSVADALEVLRMAVGLAPSFGTAFIAADMNRDGQITVQDALEVLRMAVGLPSVHAPAWVFVDPANRVDLTKDNSAIATGLDLAALDMSVTGLGLTGWPAAGFVDRGLS